jgi:prevent-host-death family protein
MAWQLQEAKRRFSEVVRRALDRGPQVVTRHGRKAVVVLAAEEFERLTRKKLDLRRFLLDAPDLSRLDIRRDAAPARRVKL